MKSLLLPQDVIDLLPTAIHICGLPSSRLVQFNRAAAELWGREPELNCDTHRFCGVCPMTTRDDSPVPSDECPMVSVLETGVPVRGFQGIIKRPDGSQVRVVANIDPIKDDSGQIIGAINVLQDVTAQLEADSAQKKMELQLGQFMNSGLFGILYWTLDEHGTCITDANDAVVALTGYTREEMESGEIRRENITPPEYSETHHKAITQALTEGITKPYESEIIAKDGHRIPVLLQGVMLDPKKQLGMGLLIDISELCAIRERAELLESQIALARKMEAVGQLAAVVAHEFNNLFMGISIQTELLLKTSDPSKAEERAGLILSNIKSGGDLTKKLLSFSHRQELATSIFDLNQLVTATTGMTRSILATNINVVTRLSEAPCWVNADHEQMERALINLIINAREAMLEGGKLVISTFHISTGDHELGLHGDVPAGAYSVMTVADTGRGISEERLGKIFEPFFTTKQNERGTGLGLSIVYGSVTQCGGHIRVRSTVGAGSTFYVYIPSVTQTQTEQPILNPRPLEISDASRSLEGAVLVVDDDALVRTSIRAYLELNGLTVRDCADASEALGIASELKDKMILLITDVVMPKMTGIELARVLEIEMPELPIIFMSGYAAGEKGHEEFGQAKFLQKPFTCATLMDAVWERLRACRWQGKNQN